MRTADAANDYESDIQSARGLWGVDPSRCDSRSISKEKNDWKVHNNNVNSAFNGFYAETMRGIKGVCYASSADAFGVSYLDQPLDSDYFPIDEDAPQSSTDAYALAPNEAEYQARSFVGWFPGVGIFCLRIHGVMMFLLNIRRTGKDCAEKSLGKVYPNAVARSCPVV